MANNFKGCLLATNCTEAELNDPTVHKITYNGMPCAVFPHKFITLNSYTTTPDQIEDRKAYREAVTRDLHRIVATGRKTAISFKTRSNLHLADKSELVNFIQSHYESGHENERKLFLVFWNDRTEDYDSGYFYIPNIKFPIIRISDDDIVYGQVDISFVEY